MASNRGSGPGRGGTGNSDKRKTPLNEQWPTLGGPKKTSQTPAPMSFANAARRNAPAVSPPSIDQLSIADQRHVSTSQFTPKDSTMPVSSQKPPVGNDQQSVTTPAKPDSSAKLISKALKEMTAGPGTAATYSAPQSLGINGSKLKVRANMFALPLSNSLDKIYVYDLAFPQINGRDLKNRKVKKEFIAAVLRQAPFHANRASIATDWTSFIIATKDLSGSDGSLARGFFKSVTIMWRNQTSTQAAPQTVDVKLVREIDVAEVQAYCAGGTGADFNIKPHLAVLNILARKNATETGQNVKVGRDKFFYAQVPEDLGLGLEARRGLFSSALPAGNGPVMNVHSIATAFIQPQKLLTYAAKQLPSFKLTELKGDQSARDWDSSFWSVVRGREVRYLYSPPDPNSKSPQRSRVLHTNPHGRSCRVNGFGQSVAEQKFTYNGNRITVQDYFHQHVLALGIELQYPHALAINTGSHEDGKETWIPPELLEMVEDQAFGGMLGKQAMRRMLPFAQKQPLHNVFEIENGLRPNGMFSSQQMRNNGLVVSPDLMEVGARMLDLPGLVYSQQGNITSIKGGPGDSSQSPLRKGKWDLKQKKFCSGGHLPTLAILELEEASQDIRKLYQCLSNTMSASGLTPFQAGQRKVIHAVANGPDGLESSIDNLRKQVRSLHRSGQDQTLDVVLVLLPDRGDNDPLWQERYATIKKHFETTAGINTVCLKREEVLGRLKDPGFCANLALKFNVKSAGGINHKLSQPFHDDLHRDGTTMIMGADVTHPGVGAIPHCPSIAAVVASNGPDAVTFPGSLKLQRSKQEMIAELKDMTVERLEHWIKCNKKWPDQILFYRDGVSDSQFSQVKALELPQIRAACAQIAQNHGLHRYEPPITLIVCGKRHHTRFYPSKDAAETNNQRSKQQYPFDGSRNMNFAPGLVVEDMSIRDPYTFDFYLQSHKALNGTARPCHYLVIENGMNMSADRLQAVTFGLCWTFATALTPISYASPAYYADRLCERGRMYLLPLLKSRHRLRPRNDAWLLAGMQNVDQANEDQKADYICQLIASDNRFWFAPGSMPARIADRMFYI